MKEKFVDVAEFDNYTIFKRKNLYNEDDVEFQNLPEENLILTTWINDMGIKQNIFEVRSFNGDTSFRTKFSSSIMRHCSRKSS
jgi:hypothetical protein